MEDKELKEKARLSEEEIREAKQKAYRHESRLSPAAFEMFGRDQAVADAQLAKARAYYEPLIEQINEQWKDELHRQVKKRAELREYYERKIKEAREHFEQQYPIRYEEEADEVGKFIDRGWVTPEEATTIREDERRKIAEYIESGLAPEDDWAIIGRKFLQAPKEGKSVEE